MKSRFWTKEFPGYQRHICSLFACWAALAASTMSFAQPNVAYVPAGDYLVRISGGTSIDVSPDGASPTWRPVLAPSEDEFFEKIKLGSIACDDRKTLKCVLGFSSAGSERLFGVPWNLETKIDIAALKVAFQRGEPINASVQDVDFESGHALISARPMTGNGSSLAPGLYDWNFANPIMAAKKVVDAPVSSSGTIFGARYLGAFGQGPVFVQTTGSPGRWDVYTSDWKLISSRQALGRIAFLANDTIGFFSDRLLPGNEGAPVTAGSLFFARPPMSAGADWAFKLAWQPTSSEALPQMDGHKFAMLAGSALIYIPATGGKLKVICQSEQDLSALVAKDVDVAVSPGDHLLGGGAFSPNAVLARTTPDAQAFLLLKGAGKASVNGSNDPTAFPVCRADTVRPIPLSAQVTTNSSNGPFRESSNADDHVASAAQYSVSHYSVATSAGRRFDFATMAKPDAKPERLLFRVYGAAGALTKEMPISKFEDDWIRRGGAIVVAKLRGGGDYDEEWRRDGRGNYKENTVDDAIAVGEALKKQCKFCRISIIGSSAGAFTAAKAALSRPDLFPKAMLISGGLDISLMQRQGVNDVEEFGAATGGFETWFAAPRATPGKSARFELVHAKNDTRADVANSENFVKHLSALGYAVDLITPEGGGHDGLGANRAEEVKTTSKMLEFLW